MKITKQTFIQNQDKVNKAKWDYELLKITQEEQTFRDNVLKLKSLKNTLNLTEKIFNLSTSSFNYCGEAIIYTKYSSYDGRRYEDIPSEFMQDYSKEQFTINQQENNNDYHVLETLSFFKDKPKYLINLVEDLTPSAILFITSTHTPHYSCNVEVTYYHPEMDQRNYKLFAKYGAIGKFFNKSID